jgi:hypothetical protein
MQTYTAWKTLLENGKAGSTLMVVGITGHQDIPPAARKFIEHRITDLFRSMPGKWVGVSSLASGADQLFAKIALRMGAELYAVIPCANYESTFADKRALNLYQRLFQQAGKVEVLNYKAPSQSAFLHAGHRVVDLCQVVVAVWDGLNARGKGGTADIVRYAQKRAKEIVVVWPSGVSRQKQTRSSKKRLLN